MILNNPLLIDFAPNLAQLESQGAISQTEMLFLDLLEIELGQRITRQVMFAVDHYYILVDGMLENHNIVIEYDGPKNHQSEAKIKKDIKRDKNLLESGFSIFRLQWFEYCKDWHQAVDIEAKKASVIIKMLIALQS